MSTEFSELQNGHRPLQLKGDLIFTSLFLRANASENSSSGMTFHYIFFPLLGV